MAVAMATTTQALRNGLSTALSLVGGARSISSCAQASLPSFTGGPLKSMTHVPLRRCVASSSSASASAAAAACAAKQKQEATQQQPAWAVDAAAEAASAEAAELPPPSAVERAISTVFTTVGATAAVMGTALGVSYQIYTVDELDSMADARFGTRPDIAPPPPPGTPGAVSDSSGGGGDMRDVGYPELAVRKFVDIRRWMDHTINYYKEPSAEKLLPDLPEAYRAHARTLVLDLDETLVHSDWTRARGWRVFKRPGVDEFLNRMSQFYELVVYTHQNHTYVEPIMDRLDPQRRVTYRLARDATKYYNGTQVRDLSRMNRDPSKLLYLTSDPKTALLHPENTIVIPPFKQVSDEGGDDDTALLDIMPFLEMVIKTNAPDVRAVVASYEGKDVIVEFRKRAAALREKREAMASQLKNKGGLASLRFGRAGG
ncbi:mitochondrial inner membrane protein [Pycnococcus provasolii]|uniref:Mitochondrial import inner membrane translocase subunit TIM50 n=1 Tax=Pycnococcus provasolii TaxID=41880 RepID=A0A830I4S9_9CHLO|nr:mitochondrial inner membrane protein [Pycnococcus provasolii]